MKTLHWYSFLLFVTLLVYSVKISPFIKVYRIAKRVMYFLFIIDIIFWKWGYEVGGFTFFCPYNICILVNGTVWMHTILQTLGSLEAHLCQTSLIVLDFWNHMLPRPGSNCSYGNNGWTSTWSTLPIHVIV